MHIKRDAVKQGLLVPDKASVRQQYLCEGAEAPDLATVKDFLRFHAAASRGKIEERITADSTNAFAEWFFAGFSRVTGTPTDEEEKSKVYKVNQSLKRSAVRLTMGSGFGRR